MGSLLFEDIVVVAHGVGVGVGVGVGIGVSVGVDGGLYLGQVSVAVARGDVDVADASVPPCAIPVDRVLQTLAVAVTVVLSVAAAAVLILLLGLCCCVAGVVLDRLLVAEIGSGSVLKIGAASSLAVLLL
ncbi:hypothetical protein Acr_09g0003260 [Actinidia rufa]|uniref:Uncharacterized protein n=1 Tax=Actinidia rufa TaxID=165716 RepID=A0A7J0F5C1_9ERIC|nr:hypothetical protein Acr_09g0003260 [Actinidia rufa]